MKQQRGCIAVTLSGLEMCLRTVHRCVGRFLRPFFVLVQKQRIFKKYALCLSLGVLIFVGVLLCTLDMASFITLFAALLTIYVAAYAIAWAKYEFHVSRQSQQMSVLAALCATDKRKSFAPALAEMTRKKLPKQPTLFTPNIIWASLCVLPSDESYLTENNYDTINMVANILRGFDDWAGANFARINFRKAMLIGVNLCDASLVMADLREARMGYSELTGVNFCYSVLTGASLHDANLCGANLKNASLSKCDLFGANLNDSNLVKANLSDADLCCASLCGANLFNTDLKNANLCQANLKTNYFYGHTDQLVVSLSNVRSLYMAELPDNIKGEILKKNALLFEEIDCIFEDK